MTKTNNDSSPEFDIGYDGHARRQVRQGLELTPAQRLQWLEVNLAEVRGLLGKARRSAAVTNADEGNPSGE